MGGGGHKYLKARSISLKETKKVEFLKDEIKNCQHINNSEKDKLMCDEKLFHFCLFLCNKLKQEVKLQCYVKGFSNQIETLC